jgi:hypothetical protein
VTTVEASPAYVSVESEGFTVSGNGQSAEAMEANLAPEPKPDEKSEDEKVSEAAAALGKKGGKASAEKRREAKPDVDARDEVEPEGEASGDVDPEKPLGKPRNDPRARMLEATREAAELKRQLAAERAERERLASLVKQPEAAPAKEAKPAEDKEPQEADFENYAEYVKAAAKYVARQAYAEERRLDQARERANQWSRGVEATISKFTERVNKVTESDPTFRDRIAPELWDLQPSLSLDPGQSPQAVNVIADEMLASDQGPGLMLHFTEHFDDFQRIAALPNSRAIAREIAKLEARLEAATAGVSSKPTSSKANPPIRPVTGAPTAVESDDENINFDDYVRRENARDKQRAARR